MSRHLPSVDVVREVRLAELDGWCRMLARAHPDMAGLLAEVSACGREVVDGLDVEALLAVDVIGAAIGRFESRPAPTAG